MDRACDARRAIYGDGPVHRHESDEDSRYPRTVQREIFLERVSAIEEQERSDGTQYADKGIPHRSRAILSWFNPGEMIIGAERVLYLIESAANQHDNWKYQPEDARTEENTSEIQ